MEDEMEDEKEDEKEDDRKADLEHFHQSCSAVPSPVEVRSFWTWALFRLSYRVFQTCAFAEALPMSKNPRSPAPHLFCQCSNAGAGRDGR